MKVQAAVLRKANQEIKIEEVILRAPRAGEVLVRLRASGICHSDLSVKNGALQFAAPLILGHEGAGEVVEVGPNVKSVVPGDRVILNNIPECGKCDQCKDDYSNLCDETGLTKQNGPQIFSSDKSFKSPFTFPDGKKLNVMIGPATFATHCVVPEMWLTPFSQDIPFEEAALIGCGVTTGFGCANYASKVKEGSTVIVFGMGSIGLNIVQGAKVAGAKIIIAVDVNPKKETYALKMGATSFVNPTNLGFVNGKQVTSLADYVKELVGSNYVDFAYEATGVASVLQTAVSLVHPFWGVCVAVGIPPHSSEYKFAAPTFLIGRTLKGVYFGNAKPITAGKHILDLYKKKKIQLSPLVTHRIPLNEINKGFDLLEKGEAIRVVIIYDNIHKL